MNGSSPMAHKKRKMAQKAQIDFVMVCFDHERKWPAAFPSTMSYAMYLHALIRCVHCDAIYGPIGIVSKYPSDIVASCGLAWYILRSNWISNIECVSVCHSTTSWQFAAMNVHAVQMKTKPIRCDWMNANISTLTHLPTVKQSRVRLQLSFAHK